MTCTAAGSAKPAATPGSHRQEDPERQLTIEKREPSPNVLRPATGLCAHGFGGADKRAHEPAFHKRADLLDLALEELHVLNAGVPLILSCQRQHLIGHVQTVGLASGGDPLCRKQNINAAAAAQVEHDFAGPECSQCGGIAAA